MHMIIRYRIKIIERKPLFVVPVDGVVLSICPSVSALRSGLSCVDIH